jgi:hypothetical protein
MKKPAERLRRLFKELIANRSDRRLPKLLGCKASKADGLMSRRRADFHHGPELFVVLQRGRIHTCNRISDHALTTLRTGLGPYMLPNFPAFMSRVPG